MKAFILTDLEGVAGVVSFEEQAYATGRYYEEAKALATREVNAAVEALVSEGVDDILVWDGHGPGGLTFELLHPAAQLLHGRPSAPRPVRDEVVRDYQIALLIGQHAMAGTPDGNLSHTQNSRAVESYTLNGRAIGELAQFALYVGAFDIPFLFLSGDDAACREAEAFVPGIVTASVKRSLSLHSAISLSAPEAHRRIEEGVKDAMSRHKNSPMAPVKWPGPYVLEKRFFQTSDADAATGPGVERVDARTVRLQSEDILEIIYA
jgi:D-amino peptidase